MAGETRQDVTIEDGKSHEIHAPGTQTPEGGAPADAGDGKSDGGDGSGTGTGEGQGAGGEGESDAFTPGADGKYTHPETKEKVDDVAIIGKYYRDKFSASTAGAQQLLDKVSTAEGAATTYKGEVDALTKKVSELTALAEGKNPEGLKAHEIQEQLADAHKRLAVLTEEQALDRFEKAVPLATGKLRDSLKALMRANPTEAPQKLWDDNLKAGAEAAAAAEKARIDAQKKGAGEKGKGTSTREPAGGGDTVRGTRGDTGLTLAEFNAKPVAERKALMEKFGINS